MIFVFQNNVWDSQNCIGEICYEWVIISTFSLPVIILLITSNYFIITTLL